MIANQCLNSTMKLLFIALLVLLNSIVTQQRKLLLKLNTI